MSYLDVELVDPFKFYFKFDEIINPYFHMGLDRIRL